LNEILTVDETVSGLQVGNGSETQQMLDVLLDSTPYGSTMGGRSRHDIAARLLKKHDRGLESSQIHKALDFLGDWGKLRGNASELASQIRAFIPNDDAYAQQLYQKWFDMLDLLRAYGIPDAQIILQPDLTKNWDYYTGIVFGIRANDSYVASGGRYDGLTQLLGGGDAFPAVGFAYYTQKLIDALPQSKSHTHVFTLTSKNPRMTIEWISMLRAANIAIELVTDNAEITIDANSASYKNKNYSQDELVQELRQ
jgi:histidyl-tRNA synthetase